MADLHGVIVYEIIESASWLVLNGVYANVTTSHVHSGLFNEIAKRDLKIKVDEQNPANPNDPHLDPDDILMGTYAVTYIDAGKFDGKLIITRGHETYKLDWIINGKPWFTGIGIRVGNHLSVSYTGVLKKQ